MEDDPNHFLCNRLQRFVPAIRRAARPYDLDPYLLGALVVAESSANPFAIRVERGFWSRYGAAIIRRARLTTETTDDTWLIYPDLASASYGLCQIMYPVALELGVRPTYPTELCDIGLNLDLGARLLSGHLRRHRGDETAALGAYNGDQSGHYASIVLGWRRHLIDSPAIDYNADLPATPL
jgi:soluble lytic murein transglycosylase-like protein